MTLVAGGLYAVAFAAVLWLRALAPEGQVSLPLGVATIFYSALLAIMAGSLASAEERHLGTLEWQALLPMAAWRQWAVKAGTALALALTLGVAWPALLAWIAPSVEPASHVPAGPRYAGGVVVLTAVSLYASSLSSSGLKAVLASLPLGLIALVGLETALRAAPVPGGPLQVFRVAQWLPAALAAGLALLAACFAGVNHRSAVRDGSRVWGQAAWILAFGLAGAGLVGLTAGLWR